MSIHKTVNGAYRHRYAPFLMPTYYVKRCSPLALPLGELSPQVTERVLQSFLNDNINLFTHITEISVDITVGESQNLLGCYPLGMVIVCPLRPRCARPPLPRGEARDARGATGSWSPQKATKRRRHSPARHIQAERHVRSAVCLLPTITVYRNCQSYFIVN